MLVLCAIGGFSSLNASIYTLTPSEQLYVMLSDNIAMNNGVVAGDVGVGVGVGAGLFVQNDAFIEASPPYSGTAYFQGGVNCSGAGCPVNVAGGTVAFSANVTTAINDYNNLITTLEGLTGATPLGAFTGGTLGPGLYDATSLTLSNATTGSLTLDAGGNPNAQFVIRASSLSVTGTGGHQSDKRSATRQRDHPG